MLSVHTRIGVGNKEPHALPHHIHIKSPDPRKAADWWVSAFGFKILSEETRPFGDRFIRCQADGGMLVSISNARTGETLAPAGSDGARWGLEHIAIESDDIEADIARLTKLGARHQEGPILAPNGVRFAFLAVPDGVRIELVELAKGVR